MPLPGGCLFSPFETGMSAPGAAASRTVFQPGAIEQSRAVIFSDCTNSPLAKQLIKLG